MEVGQEMYRYEREPFEPGTPRLIKCRIVRFTPRGFWVQPQNQWMRERFVLTGARKQYAHETKQAALDAYGRRLRKQAIIVEAQLERVRGAYSEYLKFAQAPDRFDAQPYSPYDLVFGEDE